MGPIIVLRPRKEGERGLNLHPDSAKVRAVRDKGLKPIAIYCRAL